jgi:hypothetical protein
MIDVAAHALPPDTPPEVLDILHRYDDEARDSIRSGGGSREYDARAWADLERERPEWARRIRRYREAIRRSPELFQPVNPRHGIEDYVTADGQRLKVIGRIRKRGGVEYLLENGWWRTEEQLQESNEERKAS